MKRIKHYAKKIINHYKFITLKKGKTLQPVFLIGCGRSGTTILGKTIGKHPSITYLNERRDLWHQAYPEFNIWSDKTIAPKLIATHTDVIPKHTKRLQLLFFKEQVINKGAILLEKLPINNFRLKFINSAFPNAKYIYLHRNGIEVAKSIEKKADSGSWFGKNRVKWNLINQLAAPLEIDTSSLSNYEKGLLEWRYSLEYSETFFKHLSKDKYYSLSYQSFLENPKIEIENIFSFLNLEHSEELTNNLTEGIQRKSKKRQTVTERDMALAGPYLQQSIENTL
ncbi:sulfotransferase family protein [Winogradskyella sediminis]|uniref:sulfotransferase family protein n=1 Tax=Winogradskyella sediminis TaxID=1382466 RepID=UPI003AA9360F